jgi:hypothetical protein
VKRGGNLLAGIAVVWGIALFGALVVAVVVAWPLALFVQGDVVRARSIGFGVGLLVLGVWALRTSIGLWGEHRRERDVFRSRWPRASRGVELEALGLLDRRGQPGRAATGAGNHDVDLRGGERAERTITLGVATRVHLTVRGPSDALARIVDVELEERGSAAVAGRATSSFVLQPGTYRLMTERTDTAERRPERVQSWWVGAAP